MLSKYDKYRLVYSPRTSMSNIREREEKLFNDLGICFEPGTIEIMKKHLKERLGVIDKITFISIINPFEIIDKLAAISFLYIS
jgi:hypothetical protein